MEKEQSSWLPWIEADTIAKGIVSDKVFVREGVIS